MSQVSKKIEKTTGFSLQRRYFPIVLTIGIGIVFSGLGFAVVQRLENQKIKAEFKRLAENRVVALTRGIEQNQEILLSIKSFYDSSQEVSRDEFQQFVQSPVSRYQNIQALEWIPRVQQEQRSEYEELAQADGYPNFEFRESDRQGNMVKAHERAEYFPVYYVEPYQGNEIALGFDLGSNP